MPSPGKFLVEGGTGDVFTIPAPTSPAFIRINSLYLSVSATSTVEFQSGSTNIGKAFLGTGNDFEQVNEQDGIMDCLPGEAFTISSTAGTIGGNGTYSVVGAGPGTIG